MIGHVIGSAKTLNHISQNFQYEALNPIGKQLHKLCQCFVLSERRLKQLNPGHLPTQEEFEKSFSDCTMPMEW